MVLFVENVMLTLVFLNSFVMVLVSFPMYVNFYPVCFLVINPTAWGAVPAKYYLRTCTDLL